jgi:protein gp37
MRAFLNRRYADRVPPKHIWLGVSVEDRFALSRVRHLQQAAAGVRFLSVEPLLGPIGAIDLAGIDWVIVGGESGPRARPMQPEWAIQVRDQCIDARVPFFFKQWGGLRPKQGGRELDGREWNELPGTTNARSLLAAE